jgi:pSer/pThr/pTyr-binding forkhead associated (FHA) protein
MKFTSTTGEQYNLDRTETIIGRTSSSHIVLDDPRVAAQHASIKKDGDVFIVTDLHSINGTLVNGKRLTEPKRLQPGDQVKIGGVVLTFEEGIAEQTMSRAPVEAVEVPESELAGSERASKEQFTEVKSASPSISATADRRPAVEAYAAPARSTFTPSELNRVIGRYVSAGYRSISQTENTVIMEQKSPVDALLVIGLVLVFWPGALIYALARKKQNVNLSISPEGYVSEIGYTLDKYEKAKKNGRTVGWVLIALGVGICLCSFIVQMAEY